jgi:hypothetical protein
MMVDVPAAILPERRPAQLPEADRIQSATPARTASLDHVIASAAFAPSFLAAALVQFDAVSWPICRR